MFGFKNRELVADNFDLKCKLKDKELKIQLCEEQLLALNTECNLVRENLRICKENLDSEMTRVNDIVRDRDHIIQKLRESIKSFLTGQSYENWKQLCEIAGLDTEETVVDERGFFVSVLRHMQGVYGATAHNTALLTLLGESI